MFLTRGGRRILRPIATTICFSRPLLARCSSTLQPSEFGFNNTIDTKEPIIGPLSKAAAVGVKITPRALKQHLDRYVVGQDRSKRILSTAIYHHYHRVHQQRRREQEQQDRLFRESQAFAADPFDVEETAMRRGVPVKEGQVLRDDEEDAPLTIEKSNVLCLGPTGVGKTLMVRTLAKVLDVPFSMSDCTPFTMAGYVGEDVDQAIHRLLVAANHDVRRAETGIICLDEFDKIAKPKSMHSGSKDISGEGVQQALLKIIEGTTLQLHTKPERRPPAGLPNNSVPGSFNQPPGTTGGGGAPGGGGGGGGGGKGEVVTIDTSGILFIFTGAFIGLEKIISDRVARGSMGFNAHICGSDPNALASDHQLAALHGIQSRKLNPLELAEPGDLISFGLIPEIVGRIPVTTAVEALSEEMLVRVLTEPRNALLRQYEQLFRLSGVELRFTSASLREIAKSATAMKTGARGLRTVIERLLSDAMFEAPGTSIKHVLVNEAVAKRKQPPLYFSRGNGHKFDSIFAAEEEAWVARGNKSVIGDLGSSSNGSSGGEETRERAVGFV